MGNALASDLAWRSRDWPSWDLRARQVCDLELLLNGGFAPLAGFMGRRDYESVCSRMRLANGAIFPIPVVLDVPEEMASRLTRGTQLALRDPEGLLLAALTVDEVWKPDRRAEHQGLPRQRRLSNRRARRLHEVPHHGTTKRTSALDAQPTRLAVAVTTEPLLAANGSV